MGEGRGLPFEHTLAVVVTWFEMTETQRPALVTNPAADRGFTEAAETALEEGQSAEEFQAILRRQYPNVVVRPRELSGERRTVWYVYRDGHWVAHHESEQG